MRAARLLGPNQMVMQELPEPVLGNKDVLVQVKYAGICGTDYSIYSGESSFVKNGMVKFPLTMGHEWSGVVSKLGADVEKLNIGDRVVGDTAVSCGSCFECIKGEYIQCVNSHAVGTVNAIDGAFADFIVMPERHLFLLPDNVSFKQGAIVEPIATGMYAVKRGGVRPGDIVLVHGTGPIGLAAVQLSKISGAAKVILSGRNDFKLNIGKQLGADMTVNILKDNLGNLVKDVTHGKGPDVIIEASGAVSALKESMGMVRPGGTISLVAFYDQNIENFDIDSLILNDVKLVSVAGSPVLAMTVLKLMEHGRINMDKIITHEFNLNDIVNVLQGMEKNRNERIKILLKV